MQPQDKTGRGFEFSPEHDGTLSLESAVGQAIGAASMAWIDTPQGQFDEAWASEIVTELVKFINERENNHATQE